MKNTAKTPRDNPEKIKSYFKMDCATAEKVIEELEKQGIKHSYHMELIPKIGDNGKEVKDEKGHTVMIEGDVTLGVCETNKNRVIEIKKSLRIRKKGGFAMKVSIVNPKLTPKAMKVIKAQKAFNEAPYDDYYAADYSEALWLSVCNGSAKERLWLLAKIEELRRQFPQKEEIAIDFLNSLWEALSVIKDNADFSKTLCEKANEVYRAFPHSERIEYAYAIVQFQFTTRKKSRAFAEEALSELTRLYKEKIAGDFLDYTISDFYFSGLCHFLIGYVSKIREANEIIEEIRRLRPEVLEDDLPEYNNAEERYKQILLNY